MPGGGGYGGGRGHPKALAPGRRPRCRTGSGFGGVGEEERQGAVLRHRPPWVLPACPQDVGTSSDTVTVLHGTGGARPPSSRCPPPPPHPPQHPGTGLGPVLAPLPLRVPARPPPPWSPSPGGDTPALSPSGEGRRGCPVVAAMVAPSVSQVVPVVGKRAPPPQSLPSTDQSPPVWSCCSRCQAPALSAFGEGEAPPGWGGWWVPPVPSLLAPCT